MSLNLNSTTSPQTGTAPTLDEVRGSSSTTLCLAMLFNQTPVQPTPVVL